MKDEIRRYHEPGRWQQVDVLAYKQTGTHFKDITRQVLFGEALGLQAELRYFEVAPGGHSTLERHEHAHGVLILRGAGQVLLGERIEPVAPYDLVSIPALTWHQFRAGEHEPLGFLCLVNRERDRPQLPTPEDLRALAADPAIGAFIRV